VLFGHGEFECPRPASLGRRKPIKAKVARGPKPTKAKAEAKKSQGAGRGKAKESQPKPRKANAPVCGSAAAGGAAMFTDVDECLRRLLGS